MKKFKWFSIAEWEKEQSWLSQMHAEGWRLESAGFPCIYSFSRCEPADVVYQLDYNQEGLENKSEYIRMFADCGWEYVDTLVGFSYFRKNASEMTGREEIFSDEASRLQMVERVFKGRLIPLLVIFFCTIIPQLFIQSNSVHLEGQVLFGVYLGLFIAYVIIFIAFARAYYKLKNK